MDEALTRAAAEIAGFASRPVYGLSDTELCETAAAVHAISSRCVAILATLAREAHGRDLPHRQGATSTVAWLRDLLRISPAEARTLVGLGEVLDQRPVLADAVADGAINPGQAVAIGRVLADVPDRSQGGGAGDLGKSAGLLRTPRGPVEVYAYIGAQKAADPEVSISTLCRVLRVSRSGYYAWRQRMTRPTGRAVHDLYLVEEINRIHAEFGYYGSPRVHRELLVRDHRAGRHRVARLMRVHGIHAARCKIKSRRRAAPPARRPEVVDLVRRHFTATAPNRVWFTDITQIRTGEGWLWAAVVLDAFNREVISWATAAQESPKTALQALSEAIKIRRPPKGCIIHSDRGYQFTAWDWLGLAASNGLKVSIGERKSCYDCETVSRR